MPTTLTCTALRGVPVSGIVRMTAIDFPNHLAAVLFTSGCSLRCRYCHNPELRAMAPDHALNPDAIEAFLAERRGYLDGIVVSGGEPTIHRGLPDFMEYLRSFGYLTALHTNGMHPDVLSSLLRRHLVDYVAMDVKAPPREYDRVTGTSGTSFPVSRSIDLIVGSGVPHEFRTTYHPALLTEEQLLRTMQAVVHARGQRYYLQIFRKDGVNDAELVGFGDVMLPESAIEFGKTHFPEFGVR